MLLNLQKNDILDLTKKDPSLKNVILAAGWDVAKKGFFGLGKDFDLDLVALLLDESGKLIAKDGMVYFGNKRNNGIFLHGDNLTGHGDGDDERVSVSLNNLPTRCCRIMFAVTIYEGKARKQSFSKVKNAFGSSPTVRKKGMPIHVKDFSVLSWPLCQRHQEFLRDPSGSATKSDGF